MKWLGATRSLRGKLLIAQALVILAGSVTLALVALALAPGVYRAHIARVAGVVPERMAVHLDEAFAGAMLTALAGAVAAAVLTALAVSWFAARRIAGPLRDTAAAARRLAGGAHEVRVPDPGAGDELGMLARAFNDMAAELEGVEQRRQALLADLAHELRTPLATIEGYAEGLTDGVVPAEPATWEVLRAASARLARLVEDVAAVSNAEERQHRLQLARHHAGTLVRAAADAARPAYDAKGIRLDTSVEPRLPQVAVDADRFGEVLGNLLDNAMRHTSPGGWVEVSAARRDGQVEIAVTDTGEGIPPGALPHVFERFFRVDPARPNGGSGIGLTIARAIVHAHNGRIGVSSPGPGHGTRVEVLLPPAPARNS